MARIISITSGRNGVGKSTQSRNLAWQLARLGQRVCLFDTDAGPSGITHQLKLQPSFNLTDVIHGRKSLREVVITDKLGVDLIPCGTGVSMMVDLTMDQMQDLVTAFAESDDYDWVILDTASGMTREILCLTLAAPETFVLVNTEPSSLTDAYALLKRLYQHYYTGSVRVLVNQCDRQEEGQQCFQKFQKAIQVYLQQDITLLGVLPRDQALAESNLENLDTPATMVMRELGKILISQPEADSGIHAMDAYWAQYLRLIRGNQRPPLTRMANEVENQELVESLVAMPATRKDVQAVRDEVLPILHELVASTLSVFTQLEEIRTRLDAGLQLEDVPGMPDDMPLDKASMEALDPLPVPHSRRWQPAAARANEKDCNKPKSLKRVLQHYQVRCEKITVNHAPMEMFTIARPSGKQLVCAYHASEDKAAFRARAGKQQLHS